MIPATADGAAVRFRDVLRIRPFAALYGAETQSIVGDQLARVALTVLIYQRTGSTSETALTYALTYLPTVVGGGVLSGVADRYSRRTVMIVVDTLRALLIATMALPHVGNGTLFTLLALAVFLGPAFTSAEVSLIASVMNPETYRVATGLRMITNQVAQVIGFGAGGALVLAIGARTTLAVDAATYLISAIVVTLLVRHRPPRRPGDAPTLSLPAAVRLLWQDRTLRALLALSWLAGFFVVPEGLAAPYAHALHHSSAAVGALLAMIPLGAVIGAFVVLRALRPQVRHRCGVPMAVLAGLPLVACFSTPPLAVSLLLWLVSGGFAAYQLDAITSFVQRVDSRWRGRAVGLAAAGLTASQGIGLIIFGLIASALTAGQSIAIAGAAGSVLAAMLWPTLNSDEVRGGHPAGRSIGHQQVRRQPRHQFRAPGGRHSGLRQPADDNAGDGRH